MTDLAEGHRASAVANGAVATILILPRAWSRVRHFGSSALCAPAGQSNCPTVPVPPVFAGDYQASASPSQPRRPVRERQMATEYDANLAILRTPRRALPP